MKDRIKELRKELKMSGDEFGSKLGVGRASVSQWESGMRAVPERMIKTICKEYSVNEQWLRDGYGEIFTNNDKLERYLADIAVGNDKTSQAFIKAWMELSSKDKKAVEDFIKNIAKNI